MLPRVLSGDVRTQLEDILSPGVVGFLPMVAAFMTMMFLQSRQALAANKVTGALIGNAAPDFECKVKEGGQVVDSSLSKLTKSMPTVVDFYQNF